MARIRLRTFINEGYPLPMTVTYECDLIAIRAGNSSYSKFVYVLVKVIQNYRMGDVLNEEQMSKLLAQSKCPMIIPDRCISNISDVLSDLGDVCAIKKKALDMLEYSKSVKSSNPTHCWLIEFVDGSKIIISERLYAEERARNWSGKEILHEDHWYDFEKCREKNRGIPYSY